jgi:DNA-binding transcriptional ArsR family regulator
MITLSTMIPKPELVIHPVRLRILGALAARPMTTKQIASVLLDIPQATLYRQIHVLLEGGALRVVGERTVKGIVESTYATIEAAARFDRAEFAAILPEDHMRFFGVFLGAQMSDVQGYFQQESYDTTREGMTYFRVSLQLTDKEARALRIDLLELMKRYRRAPGKGRRLRNIAVSSIPQVEEGDPS